MGWSYKRLWHLLIERDMKKTDLKDVIGISPSTLAKLSKDEVVSMEILEKLCKYFECTIEQIVEYKPSPDDEKKTPE